jgi:hypothetical protein
MMRSRIRFTLMAAALTAVFAVPGADATTSRCAPCDDQFNQCMRTVGDWNACYSQWDRCMMNC